MITQSGKNSAYLASALYRSARRERKLRISLTAFLIVLAAAFALMCVLMYRAV